MKYGALLKLFLFFCTFPLISAGSINPDRYPSLETVAKKFFDTYTRGDQAYESYIQFEKRPNGWWVAQRSYNGNNDVLTRQHFWRYRGSKYQELDFEKREEAEFDQSGYGNAITSTYNYEHCIFYGYAGWEMDVINMFDRKGNKGKREDAVQYSLARAYSAHASGLLHNNARLQDTTVSFRLESGPNSMTEAQLTIYREYRHKAIAEFQQLKNQNPDFVTIVGSIGVKTDNEYLTSFLDLLTYQNKTEALKELKPNLYTPFMRALAKNYLKSCPENAILFVSGDNSTYPILYLQAQMGYRTDVTVVDLSLLNTMPYTEMLRTPIFDAPGIDFTLSKGKLGPNKRRYFSFEDKEHEPITLRDLVLECGDKSNKMEIGGNMHYILPTNRFLLDSATEFCDEKGYIFRSEVMVLDIVQKYQGERPIYFATTIGTTAFSGLEDFCEFEGLAFRLGLHRDTTDRAHGYIKRPSLVFNRLMNDFDWSGLESLEKPNSRLCRNYRALMMRMAKNYIDREQTDSALMVLNKCIKLLPNNIVSYDYESVEMVKALYELNDFDNGNDVIQQLATNINALVSSDADNAYYHKRKLSELLRIATAFEQYPVAEEIQLMIE